MKLSALALLAAGALAGAAHAQTFQVVDEAQHATTLTAAQIATLPRRTVEVADHGVQHRYTGPLLLDVARAGGFSTTAIRGRELARPVSVAGSDGYTVTFGLGELDPETDPDLVILAIDEDGQPIGAERGPLRLVVSRDARPARSVRNAVRLTIGASLAPPAR